MIARRSALEDAGFAIFEAVLPEGDLGELRREADRVAGQSPARGGARHLLSRSALFAEVARRGPIPELARSLLGPEARATKLTLFNKKTAANWKVRWHQDVAVTVRERREVEGFTGWSCKEGVWHARPPAEVLAGIVALRLHLDDTPADNGALRVVAGSHRRGFLSRDEVARWREAGPETICEVGAGGVMAMSPLLLHASSAAEKPRNRRVLHFEYAARPLPGGLEWH